MTSFRKNKSTLIELHVDGNCTDDLRNVAEAFAKHFYITFSCTSKPFISIPTFSSDFVPLVPIDDFDFQKAEKD
jgi:hypothetical protein